MREFFIKSHLFCQDIIPKHFSLHILNLSTTARARVHMCVYARCCVRMYIRVHVDSRRGANCVFSRVLTHPRGANSFKKKCRASHKKKTRYLRLINSRRNHSPSLLYFRPKTKKKNMINRHSFLSEFICREINIYYAR